MEVRPVDMINLYALTISYKESIIDLMSCGNDMEKQAAFKIEGSTWKEFLVRVRAVSNDGLTASNYLAKFVEWCLGQEDLGMRLILGEIPTGKVEKGDDSRLAGILESLIEKIDGLDSRLSSLEGNQKK